MKEVQFEENESWDKKKIATLLVIAVLLAVGVKTFVLGENKSLSDIDVKGVTIGEEQKGLTSGNTPINIQKTFEDNVLNIKEDVENLNVVDVATSTPAVQKIINDIKNLQDYPTSAAKDACFKICSGL